MAKNNFGFVIGSRTGRSFHNFVAEEERRGQGRAATFTAHDSFIGGVRRADALLSFPDG